MTHFTAEQIAAAKENDIEAVAALIAETETLVQQRANEYAKRAGRVDADLADDLAQAGRIRIWECLAKFDGDTPREFMSYIDKALHTAMSEQRRTIRRPGVSERTARDFELAITLAGGYPYDAVRIACTDEMGPRRMTRDRAYAALLSWLGTDSLDRPYNAGEFGQEFTLGDVVAAEVGVPSDLVESADHASASRKAVREQVHRTLGLLSDRQRHVLKADHGVAPVGFYGDGPDAVLAEDMGVTPYQVKQARVKGKGRFSELYQAGAAA
ncbi:sigma-70 family RNA polymerase sigma factor [Streptomyces erythrochromogenes]|uniref:sigma-70 family RNA polymerase sigma factor n=1 Tax=Streptomyces erythrochromogenes TaxID=285574 RepID=UPI003413C142